jgi:hypothetical protein
MNVAYYGSQICNEVALETTFLYLNFG